MVKLQSKVAVVIPTHSFDLLERELLSIENCIAKLNRYSIFVVYPNRLKGQEHIVFNGCEKMTLPDHWFGSLQRYNKLKVSRFFYSLFADYKFMLTHETDAWVFGDDLEHWCNKGYDYIGAPWFEGFENPGPATPFLGVGNSGFSLRNIQSCASVLKHIEYPNSLWSKKGVFAFLKKKFQQFYLSKNRNENEFVQRFYHGNEDKFWGMQVPKFDPGFKVAPVAEAIKFSFEVAPEKLWTLNDLRLPFGCHAWHKYSPDFWVKFIPGLKKSLAE